ncbi:MAG: hypothetical protein ACI9VT_001984 [Psychroserpens sp.]|jgi:hypothetical protein
MKNICIPIIVMLAFSVGTIHAQEGKQFNFMNEQLSVQLLNQTIALSEPSLVKAQAELLRKHYDALVLSGFSKTEALQIVVAMSSVDKR